MNLAKEWNGRIMMKRWLGFVIAMITLALCGTGSAVAQKSPRAGQVIVPPSNVLPSQARGNRAHTNFLIFIPTDANGKKPAPDSTIWYGGETPSSMGCVYQTGPTPLPGCPVSSTNYNNPVGGSRMIAIVDAYDYPTAASDFITFSQQFGLPSGNTCGPNSDKACFTQVYATGSQPQSNCGWAQEAALDIEWAHAMAPKAQIVLVEAASNSFSDLFQAVNVASNMVANAGGGQVSMSWGGSEFSSEALYDSNFSTPGVTYFASSGDSGGVVIYPSASPNVISTGGTTVNRDSNGNFIGESTWSSAGAGPSAYEPAPTYQSNIYTLAQIINGKRGTPDYSFDANPASGVSVYDSTSCQGYVGWLVFGGTSVSAPSLAGIFNQAGAFDGGWDGGSNTSSVQSNIYQNYDAASSGGTSCQYQSPFYDVTSGSAGSYPAGACWDFATGIGSGRGVSGLTASSGFSLSASPSSQSVDAGSGTSYAVNVSFSGNFSGTVTLSATGLPSGAAASFTPGSLSSSGSSTMNVTTATGTPAGSYTVTITGNGGSSSHTTTVTLVVNSSGPPPNFVLGAASGTITVPVNSSSTDNITVTSSNGFTGNVSFSLSGLPPRTSSSFNPISVSITGNGSGSSTLTISANRRATQNTYQLTLTATSGSLTHTFPLTLVIGTTSSPDFSISASPSGQTVDTGQSANYNVMVGSLNNFSGTVDLTASVSPSGPTTNFPTSVSVTPSTAGGAALNVSANSTGTYSVTITGTSGSLTHSTTVTLVVGQAAGGDFSLSASPGNVTLRGGGIAAYTISVSPASGANPTVTFELSGVPGTWARSFSTNPLTGSGSTTLMVTVPSSASGNYTLAITGTNTQGTSHTVSVGLKLH
jgi:kumamolisin